MPSDPAVSTIQAYRAIAAAVAIFGGLDHDVSFIFGGALFGCFRPGASMTFGKIA
jgi:hypothetical protein